MILRFKDTGRGNLICKPEDGIFLSYNSDVSADSLCVMLDSVIDAIEGERKVSSEETALHYKDMWFIIEGDHREKCIKAYKSKGRNGVFEIFFNNWCNHPNSTGEKKDLVSFGDIPLLKS